MRHMSWKTAASGLHQTHCEMVPFPQDLPQPYPVLLQFRSNGYKY